MELNEAQTKAANQKSGKLLVVAGAGTGKTRVIVQRISNLLDEGIEPGRILAVTFTEKAASEMLERVLESRPDLHADLPILTFNAFGEGMLREFNTEIGLSSNFLLLGESAQIVFLEQHLDGLELDFYAPVTNPKSLLPDLAKYFSRLKQHVVTPESYQKFVRGLPATDSSQRLEKAKHKELARAYANYIRLCKEFNVIDYDDQIYRAIELLRARPNIQKLLQERYRAIMIDEFQDTNPMQSVLIDLLSSPDNSLMVVGDDDQSIYGFRGATLANILDFKKRHPNAKEVALIQNYRSGQKILDAAYTLVQHNNPHRLEVQLGIDKRLRALEAGRPPDVRQFSTLDYELQWLVDDVTERLARGESPDSIAVLARRNITAERVGQAFHLADIKYRLVGERYHLYKTEVVRMIIEALRAIADPGASLSLYHTLGSGLFNIPGSLLAEMSGQARLAQKTLEEQLRSDSNNQVIAKALETITQWRDQATILPVGKLVYAILDDTGYKGMLYGRAASDQEAANTVVQLSEFFRTLSEFESISLQPTAAQYLESFPVLEAAGESSQDNSLQISHDRVNILTIHKAKGLEWDTVYIPDCVEGSFPLQAISGGIALPEKLVAKHSSAADEHIAEERRLMYVAMTRARHNLILTYSRSHNGQTTREPSKFLAEIFGKNKLSDSDGTKTPSSLELATKEPYDITAVSLPRKMFDGKILRLSVSQIDCFLRCPLDFYYRYVLNVPSPDNTQALYGQAIHSAIEDVNKALLEGAKINLKQLEETLTAQIDAMPTESKLMKQRLQTQAMNTLRNFYQAHYQKDKRVPVAVESAFNARLQDIGLVITGRLDAVFETEKGVEIRDYKTSTSVDTEAKAKQRATSSPQLTLYALVWQRLHDERPARLTLEFVDTGVIGSVAKTQRGIDTMEAKLKDVRQKITTGSFAPGSNHTFCQHPLLK